MTKKPTTNRRPRTAGKLPADLYARLFEASPDPFVLQSFPGGRLLAVNRAFEQVFDLRRDEVIGRTVLEIGLPEDAEPYRQLIELVEESGEVINAAVMLRSHRGHAIACHVSASLLDVDAQRCMLWIIGDITAHKRTEDALRSTNAVLRAISAAQSKSLVESDPQRLFSEVLADLLSLTGSAAGFIGEMVPERDGSAAVRTLSITGSGWALDADTADDGRRAPEGRPPRALAAVSTEVLNTGSPVISRTAGRDPQRDQAQPGVSGAIMGLPLHYAGTLVGLAVVGNGAQTYDQALMVKLEPFLNTCGAIVQFLRSQRERERMEKTLLENQALLVSAQRLTNLGSWETDLVNMDNPDNNPLRWSEQAYRIFGFEPGEIEMDSDSFLRCVHPDDRQYVREAELRALQHAEQYSLDYRIVRPDGGIRFVKDVGEILRDPRTGMPLRIVGAVRDVTEQKFAEEQLHLAAQVFESSHEAMMIIDAHRKIVAVNHAFTQITGFAAAAVVGSDARQLGGGRGHESMHEEIWESVDRSGFWQGEIWARRASGESYPQSLSLTAICDHTGRVKNYIWVAEDITERRRAQEHIHRLAHYDALTDLPNRTLLRDRLSQALNVAARNQSQVAVLFLDLDRFKTINDSLGHPIGDQLLQVVAGRLRTAVREVDTVARLGGDEFLVVLPGTGEEGAAQVAGKIRTVVAEPLRIDRQTLTITPSIGISVYPQDGQDIDALIRSADAALYHAKDHGRNRHQFFSTSMSAAALENISLESGLRVALERGQLLLHYQPQFDARSGRVVGVEALVRWRHPEWGLVQPARFVPVAEDSGLIVPIGRWILQEACRQNRAWQEAGLPAVPVAVNLSALQFRQTDFQQMVRGALATTGLPPDCLELELTESILMRDAGHTITDLAALSELGVGFSVDDFGTGYSSLSYLKRFPIDKLKIDRSFIHDVTTDADDAAIVRAVISLAHSLQMTVIAEGVETREQLDFLLAGGCDVVQGYYFARPMPAGELMPLLRTQYTPASMAAIAPAEPAALAGDAPTLHH